MPKKACGFVLFRKFSGEIQYLLMKASYGDYHWSPPKGHVDKGENDMETAYRETEEEAGFTKEDLKVYEDCKQELNYLVKNKPKIVIYWLAELINPAKPVKMSKEHTDYKWAALDDACKISGYSDMQNTLKSCDAYITEKLL